MQHRHTCKSIHMKWLCLLSGLIFFQTGTFAQDTITIEQAIATALQNNYDIRLARNDSIIAAVNFSYRNVAFLPTLNANGTLLFNNNSQSQTYSGNVVKSRTGILSNNANAGLSTTWVLFNGFKMFIYRTRLGQLL